MLFEANFFTRFKSIQNSNKVRERAFVTVLGFAPALSHAHHTSALSGPATRRTRVVSALLVCLAVVTAVLV